MDHIKTLQDIAIQRYKTRDTTLFRLLTEVKDTDNTLQSLVLLLEVTNQG